MKFKNISGFDFVKVSEAYLSDTALKATFNGKPLDDWKLKLKLVVNESILDAEQSAYLVFKNDDILYVGYFSNSFKKRWWKKKGYFWHGDILDNKVNELVKSGHDVSVWISVNPYFEQFNISKIIEDSIIMKYADKGIINTVGKSLKKDKINTYPVREILEIDCAE
ncbi:MAG: hypothetical protein ACJAS1_006162 [Oleiphilaceae bacterium]|jgi:hypothetical protein